MPPHERTRKEPRRRRRRSSSPSSSSDDAERRKRRVEKLSKKVVKHLKKHHVATEGCEATAENRFQDPHLNERFIWSKKIEQQLESGVSVKDLDARAERERQRSRLEEIEKVKRNREERETERARQQDELSMIERARLASEAASALEKEEEFLLQQAVASSRVRIENGRMRPIDALVRIFLPDLNWGQSDPAYKILSKMNISELEALLSEIAEFKVLDSHDADHVEYWQCIEALCQHELNIAKKQESQEPGDTQERSAFTRERQFYVEDEIKNMLTGKELSELVQLEHEIRDLLSSSDSIDPDYWTRVLDNLEIEKLKTKIRNVQVKVQKATADQVPQTALLSPQVPFPFQLTPSSNDRFLQIEPNQEEEEAEEVEEESLLDDDDEEDDVEMEECPSPEPVTVFDGTDVVPEDEDYDQIALLRREVKLQYAEAFKKHTKDMSQSAAMGMPFGSSKPVAKSAADSAKGLRDVEEFNRLKSAAISSMGSDEGYMPFGGEVELDSHVYWWHEKYRPRKPKYFNRVHTGYEWNKYNQTHYDHDNPPPKVVQGYKFNIFYPDLIDKKTPPHYEIENDPDSKDSATCWLRFKAGPPYEDLAFRIVNKEWEYSHKKGFKCTFERGILHLYFNFKRQRYRR